MKKLLFAFAIIATITATANAQWKYGAGVTLGTNLNADRDLGFGINARADYDFNEKWSIAPGFTWAFPSSNAFFKRTSWQLNADAQYNLLKTEASHIYGLAGLNYSYSKFKAKESLGILGTALNENNGSGEVGLNLGAGANFGKFFGELKYDTAFEQLGITVGILFGGE